MYLIIHVLLEAHTLTTTEGNIFSCALAAHFLHCAHPGTTSPAMCVSRPRLQKATKVYLVIQKQKPNLGKTHHRWPMSRASSQPWQTKQLVLFQSHDLNRCLAKANTKISTPYNTEGDCRVWCQNWSFCIICSLWQRKVCSCYYKPPLFLQLFCNHMI